MDYRHHQLRQQHRSIPTELALVLTVLYFDLRVFRKAVAVALLVSSFMGYQGR
jgi:hypothetical protein